MSFQKQSKTMTTIREIRPRELVGAPIEGGDGGTWRVDAAVRWTGEKTGQLSTFRLANFSPFLTRFTIRAGEAAFEYRLAPATTHVAALTAPIAVERLPDDEVGGVSIEIDPPHEAP